MKRYIIFIFTALITCSSVMGQSYLLLSRDNWVFKEVPGLPESFTKKYQPIDPIYLTITKKVYVRLPAKVIYDTTKVIIVEKPIVNNYYKNSLSVISIPAVPAKPIFMPSIPKYTAVDPINLNKQRTNGIWRISGGTITAVTGVVLLATQWKPTEINSQIYVDKTGIRFHSETISHALENTVVATTSGILVGVGAILIHQGCKRIKASNNGIILIF